LTINIGGGAEPTCLIVYSRTLAEPRSARTQIVREFDPEAVRQLRLVPSTTSRLMVLESISTIPSKAAEYSKMAASDRPFRSSFAVPSRSIGGQL
jgi:hypothetical protein